MILLIPIDKKNIEEAKIEYLNKKIGWILIKMDAGIVSSHLFLDKWEDTGELIDYLVVKDKNENIEDFLDEGIEVLMAPTQIYIEDVIEAYKFKELHEI